MRMSPIVKHILVNAIPMIRYALDVERLFTYFIEGRLAWTVLNLEQH